MVWLTIAGGLALILWPLFSPAFHGGALNAENAAQYGGFVTGYAGTFLLLANALLLFWNLRDQNATAQRERFEAKYFTMLKLHRQNVAELQLKDLNLIGRSAMPAIRSELKRNFVSIGWSTDDLQRAGLAFLLLYFGGNGLTTIEALIDPKWAEKLPEIKNKARAEDRQDQLGHYYRHLYQAVRYVDQQDCLSAKEKYDFVKTIRAQLSTDEQALLLCNSLSRLGKPWWGGTQPIMAPPDQRGAEWSKSQALILEYRMVKNLPKAFLDPDNEIDVTRLFGEGYFEWEE